MISFTVHGLPIAQGSKVAMRNFHTGKPMMKDSNQKKLHPWRSLIHDTAVGAMNDSAMLEGPLNLTIGFVLPRPKAHYGTGKNATALKASAPQWHDKTPDLDKLLRAVCDALTGIVWKDDSQVATVMANKSYGDDIGCAIQVTELKTGEGGGG